MASAAGPFPIYYNPDVHNFYLKQKQEFHFNQKSDNEFLMFLLDTAVRVISIVQHLAPVIEAVSDASTEIDDLEDISPVHTPNPLAGNLSGSMEVDTTVTGSQLSAELEQINQEITNAQITSQQLQTAAVRGIEASEPMEQSIQLKTLVTPPQTSIIQPQSVVQSSLLPTTSILTNNSTESSLVHSLTPTTTLHTTSAQSSENLSTILPPATQPIAEPPPDPVKSEDPVPEIIEIKEEIGETNEDQGSGNELLTQDSLQQLMTSISGTESGLQNFVPTASPSSLPPSFLDRTSKNPLSMVGSLNTADNPGPSGINVPNISESMMKNISDAGLDISGIKGQGNPIGVPKSLQEWQCGICSRVFYGKGCKGQYNRHFKIVHLKIKPFRCDVCGKRFSQQCNKRQHIARYHAYSAKDEPSTS